LTVLIETLATMGLLKDDLHYHFIQSSIVIIYFFFGYQKWFDHEAKGLAPFFKHGGERCGSDKGYGSARCIVLSAEAGHVET
jgi:hypothetical protein